MNGFVKKSSNNTSGIKNIFYNKNCKRWTYQKQIFGNKIEKSFKTKEEAISFKTEYELNNPQFQFKNKLIYMNM